MKFLPPILAWLTLTLPCLAEITITAPPSYIMAGEPIQVFITGLDEKAVPVIKHFPRAGTNFVPARTLDGSGVFAWFLAKLPGEYLIFVCADGEYAEATIVVGGPQPDPFPQPEPDPKPKPNPDPRPIPSDQLSVVILCETQTRTGDETLALLKIRAYASQERLAISIVDQDLISGSTDKAPPWLKPWSYALNQSRVQVPALLIGSSKDGVLSVVAVEPLTTGEKAIELVKKWGG